MAARASSQPDRHGWQFELAVLVLPPAAAVGFYGYLQESFWQQLDVAQKAPDATTLRVDPEAMVARL